MAAARATIALVTGQRIVPLPFSYVPNTGSLFIAINGKALSHFEYTELSVNSIALIDPAVTGESLEARNFEPVAP